MTVAWEEIGVEAPTYNLYLAEDWGEAGRLRVLSSEIEIRFRPSDHLTSSASLA
jgi:hypothetical protein